MTRCAVERTIKLARLLAVLGLSFFVVLSTSSSLAQSVTVPVKKQGSSYILQNAFVTAEIDSTTGDLKSMKCKGLELMGYKSGHQADYWEQNPSSAAQLTDKISIDAK